MEPIVRTVFGRVLDWLLLCESFVQIVMAKKNKKTQSDTKKILDYDAPGVVGNQGSVSQYAQAKGISRPKAKKELEKNLAYTLHKPRRRRGMFQPVVVFDTAQQWVADLVEVQTLAKQKILKSAQRRKPQTLQTDAGKEFYNQVFQTLMKQQNIYHFSTHGDAKASIVERLNRTVKSKTYKIFYSG